MAAAVTTVSACYACDLTNAQSLRFRDEEQMIRASRAQDKGAVAQEDIALGEKEKAFVEDLW